VTDSGTADAGLPDIFVARQPVFDTRHDLFGYELLFRSSHENRFDSPDQEQATLSVIANSFFVFGIGTLAGNARAFVNFTRQSILNDYAYALPRECLVVEILEDVKPDPDVLAACRRLKSAGYILALDDFDQRQDTGELLDVADIVKVDFAACDDRRRASYAHDLVPRGIALLAEKVETREDCEQALRRGYTYLQGYFFARPEVLVTQQAPALRAGRLEIIRELHRAQPDLRKVEDLFKHDPDLTYKLLRHLNSAAFAFRSQIQTIWRAITILGERGMRAWTSVVVLAGLGGDRSSELVVTSVTRGRFCELIGQELRLGAQCEDLFLMGLFSLIDAITRRPLDELLSALPLSEEARRALLGTPNRFRLILELIRVYERGQWSVADQLIGNLGLRSSQISSLYLDAAKWGNQSRHID